MSDVAPTEAAAPRYGDLGTARAPQDGGTYTELGDGPTPADVTHGAYRVISPTYSTERPRAIAGEASYAVLGALTATNRRGGVPEGGYQTLGQVRALSADGRYAALDTTVAPPVGAQPACGTLPADGMDLPAGGAGSSNGQAATVPAVGVESTYDHLDHLDEGHPPSQVAALSSDGTLYAIPMDGPDADA